MMLDDRHIVLLGSASDQIAALHRDLNERSDYCCTHADIRNGLRSRDLSAKCVLFLFDFNSICGHASIPIMEKIQAENAGAMFAFVQTDEENYPSDLLFMFNIKGVFYKDTPIKQLVRGINAIFNGEYWLPRCLLARYLENLHSHQRQNINFDQSDLAGCEPKILQAQSCLTKRESQIIELISNGRTNNDIANQLSISSHTVKTHIYNAFKKINTHNRVEAANWVRGQS